MLVFLKLHQISHYYHIWFLYLQSYFKEDEIGVIDSLLDWDYGYLKDSKYKGVSHYLNPNL